MSGISGAFFPPPYASAESAHGIITENFATPQTQMPFSPVATSGGSAQMIFWYSTDQLMYAFGRTSTYPLSYAGFLYGSHNDRYAFAMALIPT